MNTIAHAHAQAFPAYSDLHALRTRPAPLLLEPVPVDAALARLLQPATASRVRAQAPVEPGEAEWLWREGCDRGLDVVEHQLPEGIDFLQFQALLCAPH